MARTTNKNDLFQASNENYEELINLWYILF